MSSFMKKLLDSCFCIFGQLGCFAPDKEHSYGQFRRQYRISGLIGAGGFGRVYKAHRISDGLPVAIKHIRHKRIHEWMVVGRRNVIPAEIHYLEKCQDVEGVVRLIDWFCGRHGFMLVMERPEHSMDLFDLINTFGRLEEHMARRIFAQVVDTVAKMHVRHAVIHRDIKDENIVVDVDSGRVLIVDFGATELFDPANVRQFKGTMTYSPPEVFERNCCQSLEGTVWSLGILLYTLVFGKPPFQNELQIRAGKLRFPRNVVSSECRSLIRRCLCHSPKGRISLEQLKDDKWLKSEENQRNFMIEWRRRKRGSLRSTDGIVEGVGAELGKEWEEEEDEEDCSYRTEAGAEPGPLTIPKSAMERGRKGVENGWAGDGEKRMVDKGEEEEEEDGGREKRHYETCAESLAGFDSNPSSNAGSESGFETAFENTSNSPSGDIREWTSFCPPQIGIEADDGYCPGEYSFVAASSSPRIRRRSDPGADERHDLFSSSAGSSTSATTYFSANSQQNSGWTFDESISDKDEEEGSAEDFEEEMEEEDLTLRAENPLPENNGWEGMRKERSKGQKNESEVGQQREEESRDREEDDGEVWGSERNQQISMNEQVGGILGMARGGREGGERYRKRAPAEADGSGDPPQCGGRRRFSSPALQKFWRDGKWTREEHDGLLVKCNWSSEGR